MKTIVEKIRNLLIPTKGNFLNKCSEGSHSFRVIIPTLSRRFVTNCDSPCQCGKYKNATECWRAESEEFNKKIKDIVEKNK